MDTIEIEKHDGWMSDLYYQAKDLSTQQVAKLERDLLEDPHNAANHVQLLGYYVRQEEGSKKIRSSVIRHLCWVIENLGDFQSHHSICRYATSLKPKEFAIARACWFEQLEIRPSHANLVGNAGSFLIWFDFENGEKLLRKAQQLAPLDSRWIQILGQFSLFEFRYCPDLYKEKYAKIVVQESLRFLQLDPGSSIEHMVLAELSECALYLNQLDLVAFCADQLAQYGDPIFDQLSNCLYGMIAVRRNEIDKAAKFLLKAEKGYDLQMSVQWLAEALWHAGQVEVIAEFIENYARVRKINQKFKKLWSTQLSQGICPTFGDKCSSWY